MTAAAATRTSKPARAHRRRRDSLLNDARSRLAGIVDGLAFDIAQRDEAGEGDQVLDELVTQLREVGDLLERAEREGARRTKR